MIQHMILTTLILLSNTLSYADIHESRNNHYHYDCKGKIFSKKYHKYEQFLNLDSVTLTINWPNYHLGSKVVYNTKDKQTIKVEYNKGIKRIIPILPPPHNVDYLFGYLNSSEPSLMVVPPSSEDIISSGVFDRDYLLNYENKLLSKISNDQSITVNQLLEKNEFIVEFYCKVYQGE